MAIIAENGGGVRGANTYQVPAAVTAYLTTRNRQDENSWSTLATEVQEAACVAATDYIDRRFGPKFLGRRQFTLEGAAAAGSVTLSGLPSDGDEVSVQYSVFTFRSSPSGTYDVQIGADADASAAALAAKVTTLIPAFTTVAAGSVVTVTSTVDGASGNFSQISATGANLTAATFSGGLDGGDQPLEWPRVGVPRRDGSGAVVGLPVELLHAHAEYAVRAVTGALEADPEVPVAGQGPVTEIRERVEGAIDTHTKYAAPDQVTGLTIIQPYPAADQLLADFVRGLDLFGRYGRV